jgi:ADP-heptose:LPS heptosyltransferase
MVRVGEIDGSPTYMALDAEDEKAIGNRDTIVCSVKSARASRTALQNRAEHKYFYLLAKALNDAGLDMVATMKKLSKNAMIPWSPLAIKERLWKPVQKDTYSKESTTELDTDEVSVVYEALNRVTSDKLGVSVPFPDRYSQMCEQIGR